MISEESSFVLDFVTSYRLYPREARLISGIQNEVQDRNKEFFEIRNLIKTRMRGSPCKLVVREFAECTPVLLPDVPCSPRSSRQILAR